jgi:hypothetical protein
LVQWVNGLPVPFAQAAWKAYVVSLKDGSEYEVNATNEYHAGSLVVYGGQQSLWIDGRSGEPLNEVKVHRDNIVSIVQKDA